jgi:site-specific DNA recombinase
VRLLDLAHDARRLFAKQEPQEKRRLLNFVLSNSTWKNCQLSVTFRQPFDLLVQTTAIVAGGNPGRGLNSPGHPGWLANQNKTANHYVLVVAI